MFICYNDNGGKNMKKNNLIKGIVICFLIYAALTWIIGPSTVNTEAIESAVRVPLGLLSLVYYPALTVALFLQYGLVILAIGGIYGVMRKTGAYANLVDNMASKLKGKEKKSLIIIMVIMALFGSVIGLNYLMLILIPLIIAILTKAGFNRITAMAGSIGALMLGSVASTFGINSAVQIAQIAKIDVASNILFKFAFLTILIYRKFVV